MVNLSNPNLPPTLSSSFWLRALFADSTTPEATRSAPTQTLCRSHRYSSNSDNEMQSVYLVLPRAVLTWYGVNHQFDQDPLAMQPSPPPLFLLLTPTNMATRGCLKRCWEELAVWAACNVLRGSLWRRSNFGICHFETLAVGTGCNKECC